MLETTQENFVVNGAGNQDGPPPPRLQSVSKGKEILDLERHIVVVGTVSGHIEASSVTAWRLQKTAIKAKELIHIKKEVIGSESFEMADDKMIAEKGSNHPKTINAAVLSSPTVVIGVLGEGSSASKNIRIHTEHLFMHDTSVLGELEVILGEKLYRQLREVEKRSLKIKRRLKTIALDIENDLEDLGLKARRPGNEDVAQRHRNFLRLLESHAGQKQIILPCLRDILMNLKIVNYQPIMQRWEDEFDLKVENLEIQKVLALLVKRLNLISLDLQVKELTAGSQIIFRYGDKKYVLKGPKTDLSLLMTHKLVKNSETEELDGTLEIK